MYCNRWQGGWSPLRQNSLTDSWGITLLFSALNIFIVADSPGVFCWSCQWTVSFCIKFAKYNRIQQNWHHTSKSVENNFEHPVMTQEETKGYELRGPQVVVNYYTIITAINLASNCSSPEARFTRCVFKVLLKSAKCPRTKQINRI